MIYHLHFKFTVPVIPCRMLAASPRGALPSYSLKVPLLMIFCLRSSPVGDRQCSNYRFRASNSMTSVS
jgi:hypothetical protein